MKKENKKMSLGAYIANFILTLLVFPALILWLSGDWSWREGWIFSLWFSVMIVSNTTYMYFKNPALLAERSKMPGSDNQKGWDKYYVWFAYSSLVVWLIIMPLDAKRYGWTALQFPVWLKILGGIALIPALFFLLRSVVDNTFASTLVRIQDERKQHVVSTGVYAFVRHPMYLGNTLMLIGAPLLMNSLFGLIIGLIGVFGMAARILGEEKMLIEELEGYEDYKKKVKYRLIPFVW